MSKEFMSRKYLRWERTGIQMDSRAFARRSSEIAKFTFLRLLPALEIVRTYAEEYTFKKDEEPHKDPYLYGDYKSYCQIVEIGMKVLAFSGEQNPYGLRFNLDGTIDVVLNADLNHTNIPGWTRNHGNLKKMNGYYREIESFVPSLIDFKAIPHFISQLENRLTRQKMPIILFSNLSSPLVSAGFEVPWHKQISHSRSVKRKLRIKA